jgi:hypothetical protein
MKMGKELKKNRKNAPWPEDMAKKTKGASLEKVCHNAALVG